MSQLLFRAAHSELLWWLQRLCFCYPGRLCWGSETHTEQLWHQETLNQPKDSRIGRREVLFPDLSLQVLWTGSSNSGEEMKRAKTLLLLFSAALCVRACLEHIFTKPSEKKGPNQHSEGKIRVSQGRRKCARDTQEVQILNSLAMSFVVWGFFFLLLLILSFSKEVFTLNSQNHISTITTGLLQKQLCAAKQIYILLLSEWNL